MRLDEIDLTDLDRFAPGFPHELFSTLRREAPVLWHPPTAHTPGGEGFWVLSRHADILGVASDGATFSSHTGPGRDGGGGTLIEDLPGGFAAGVLLNCMDDPRHQRIRRVVTPAVGPRALAAVEAEVRARTEALVDAAMARGECDFLTDVAVEVPLQAAARLLGVPQHDRHRLLAWADANTDYDDRDLGQESERTRAASAESFEYGTALLEAKRRDPGDDLLSLVARAEIEGDDGTLGPLTPLEQQMFFNLLLTAASETTRNTLAVGLLALVEHPDQWDALRDDRDLLVTAVEEVLRWASSTTYNRRTATRDVDVRGHTIRAGEKVTLWWASANRDEAVFADPFRFDVRRDPNRHLTFGHGSHFCLGANLARLEIRIVLETLLDRDPVIELAGPVEHTRSNKHAGVRHMPVRFRTR